MASSWLEKMRIPFLRLCAIGIALVFLAPVPLFAQQAPQGPPVPEQGPAQGPQQAEPGADPHAAEELAAERQALGFLGYLDHGRYADSYAYTGILIRNQLDREAFATKVEQARANTGTLQSRELVDAGYTTSVPGAPQGQYVVLHYHSSFAKRPDTLETLTLALAKGYWRVDGWYIK
jgi:Protein of unknown function (DUF4019)